MKIGDKVQILQPAYVAGQVGEICAQEILSSSQSIERWIIRVEAKDIVVSLPPQEFQVKHISI